MLGKFGSSMTAMVLSIHLAVLTEKVLCGVQVAQIMQGQTLQAARPEVLAAVGPGTTK